MIFEYGNEPAQYAQFCLCVFNESAAVCAKDKSQ